MMNPNTTLTHRSRSASNRAGRGPAAGFSMMEMIGVLAIMAIVAAMVLPNVARRLSRAAGEREDKALVVFGDGLLSYVRTYQTISGEDSWTTNISTMTGLSVIDVAQVYANDPASARVYLIDPSFEPSTPSGPGFADPLWQQNSAGASSVTNTRILLISTHKSNLSLPVSSGKASSQAEFNNIWDWEFDMTTKAPPTGWPAAWNDNGEYLHVHRVNLAAFFQRITFSNDEYPLLYPSAQFGTEASTNLDAAAAMDAFYLQGTYLRLYKDPGSGGDLDLSHSIEAPMNFLYESNRWRIP